MGILSEISNYFNKKILIFFNCITKLEDVKKRLIEKGYNVSAVQAKIKSDYIFQESKKFRNAHSGILLSTDIFTRGIDFKDISLVFNYDMPETCVIYIHRIGRTGRAGRKGDSVTFLTNSNEAMFIPLSKILLESCQEI